MQRSSGRSIQNNNLYILRRIRNKNKGLNQYQISIQAGLQKSSILDIARLLTHLYNFFIDKIELYKKNPNLHT